jgi:hypothetical protein
MKLDKFSEVMGRAGDLIAEELSGPACSGVEIM